MSDTSNDRAPTFRSLSAAECDALLARHHVGRIAFAFHDRVDIQPIHYVFANGSLVGRTSEGAKLVTLEHNRWLAFEVDEVHGLFDWQSVVVQGTFQRLNPEGTETERGAATRAVEALRALVPEMHTATDPVAFRTVFFQIVIREMTGRAASSGAPASAP
jgi:nitroimidazol reductase NimA-like FMN-containing flavoprotein (pyridoxamine 5'-phosphate oxidase superfamily)